MRIECIDISGVGGITDLHLEFASGMNLICGPNGIGASTIHHCVGQCFGRATQLLRKNRLADKGSVRFTLDAGGQRAGQYEVPAFEPAGEPTGRGLGPGAAFGRDCSTPIRANRLIAGEIFCQPRVDKTSYYGDPGATDLMVYPLIPTRHWTNVQLRRRANR